MATSLGGFASRAIAALHDLIARLNGLVEFSGQEVACGELRAHTDRRRAADGALAAKDFKHHPDLHAVRAALINDRETMRVIYFEEPPADDRRRRA